MSAFAKAGTPCFKAYSASGAEISTFCVNQEVTFQDCGNIVPDEQEYYVFDYKSGSPIPSGLTTEKKHTYTTPGKYRVLHIGNYGGTTLTDTVSHVFEVKASPNPDFTITPCANNSIIINIKDNNYDNYFIDFGDGNLPTTVKPDSESQHRYSSSGNYTVTVMGLYIGNSCNNLSQKQVNLLPSLPTPRLQSLTVVEQNASGTIQLELQQLQPGYRYVVEEGQDRLGYQAVATIENVSQNSLTYSLKINTETGKTYRIRPTDACGTVISNVSNVLGNIALSVSAANEEATITWNTPSNLFKEFELYRDGTLIETLPYMFSSYIDNGLICGKSYSYQIKGITDNGSTSASVTKSVQITSSTRPAPPYLFSTFDTQNQIILAITLPKGEQAQKIELEKSINGAAFTSLASINQASYTDAIPEPTSICYRATFTDLCSNTSDYSNVSCPILLRAEKQQDGSVKLDWSAYSGFPNGGIQSNVELLDANNNVVNSYPVTGTTYTDQVLSNELQLLRYRINATSINANETTYSNTVAVEQDVALYVPSAFSPNADGLNDTFEVKGKLFSNFSIRIYNSLGNVVYQSSDAGAGWDGTYKGEPVPVGAYAYEITVKTSFGATKRKTGTVTLLR